MLYAQAWTENLTSKCKYLSLALRPIGFKYSTKGYDKAGLMILHDMTYIFKNHNVHCCKKELRCNVQPKV